MLRDKNNFFAQLFNSTQSFVALYKPQEHKFVQVNTFGIRMFEMQDTDEFVSFLKSGKIWPEPHNHLSSYLDEIETVVNAAGQMEKEILYQTASGRPFWGLLRVDTLDIADEKHFLIKITDIDVFKKSQLKAVQNAQQFQALFNNSTIGIIITNQDGQIINFNQHGEDLFGYLKEEIVGQPVEILIPQPSRGGHKKYRDTFIQHPQNRTMGAGRDLFAQRKDGSEFPVEISLSPYRLEEKNYVIAFVIDISIRKRNEVLVLKQKDELKKISEQVIEMNTELEKKVEGRTQMLKETLVELENSKEELSMALEKERELGELKSRFVTMASHEFRTPLSTILSSSYLVQQYVSAEDQEKRNKHLVKIQHAVQTLTFILEDFLSLEKLEEGQVQVKFDVLTSDELIREIENIQDEMSQMLKNGQTFHFSYTSLAPITTDRKLLRNILVNLISNAIKYSPENTTIKIYCTTEDNRLKISVSDRGIGIPETEQKHLFERFFRATNASTIQGTGLGLHIVKRYLNLIRGDIDMTSLVGKGTTFTVLLNTNV